MQDRGLNSIAKKADRYGPVPLNPNSKPSKSKYSNIPDTNAIQQVNFSFRYKSSIIEPPSY